MQEFQLGPIPCALWGAPAARVVLAVHGSGSNKADAPIRLLAQRAAEKGAQVLSFDLPGHGARPAGPCTAQEAADDLRAVLRWAQARWTQMDLFACSLGAYCSLLACADAPLGRAWFLSPVVDMRRLIEERMAWLGVTAARLAREREIPTPMGEPLSWDYYAYVCAHPVEAWPLETYILRGAGDDLCGEETILAFARRFSAAVETVPGAGHYFHTDADLRALDAWLARTL